MTEPMTHAGYLSTKQKLANMEARLAALRARTDLDPAHRAGVEQSYLDMMRQYSRELKLYEAANVAGPASTGDQPTAPAPTES